MSRMNKSMMMVLLMLFSSVAGMAYAPQAEAAQVVITESVQIVDGGSVNDRMVAMAADSEGNIHAIWSRNTQHLYYTMHLCHSDIQLRFTSGMASRHRHG